MGRQFGAVSQRGRDILARLVALAVLVPIASGCGLLGGLKPTQLGTPETMSVTSPGFGPETDLPAQYTCYGAGLSPPLHWSGALSKQPRSFAIVIDDGQAPITPWVYWIVFGISGNTTDIAQNQLPTGARVALNSAGTARYQPPCPVGSGTSNYRFTVYALNATLRKLPDKPSLRQTWLAIAHHVIAVGRMTVKAKAPA